MHSDAARPYPVDYIHPTGEQARIDFTWGAPQKVAPIGIIIWVKDGEGYAKLGETTGEWQTFRDAKLHGIELASKLISLYAGLSDVLGWVEAR
ncbi:hypothetical protein ACVBEG_11940 [Pseudomonas sp. GG8]